MKTGRSRNSYSAVDAVPGPSTPVNIPLAPPREHEFEAGSLVTIYNAVQLYADRCAGLELKL